MTSDIGTHISESSFVVSGLIRNREIVVRRHAAGFCILKRKREHLYPLDSIEAFTFSKVSSHFGRTPSGLTYYMAIWRVGETHEKPAWFSFWKPAQRVRSDRVFGLPIKVPFNFTTINPTYDETLENICADLTVAISARLLARLERDGSAPWIPDLYITRGGLEYHANDGRVQKCAFHEIRHLNIEESACTLLSSSADLPKLSLDTTAINFYPGFTLLEGLLSLA